MAARREFTAAHAYPYDQRSTLRWIVSHAWRYRLFAIVALAGYAGAWAAHGQAQVLIGRVAQEMIEHVDTSRLLALALTILGLLVADGLAFLLAGYAAETVAARFEADAREELYASLLAKSQSYHDRQRVGDLMARATDDASQLGSMIIPGATLLYETLLGLAIPLAFIGAISVELLIVPLLFLAGYVWSVRAYARTLGPVIAAQREQHGQLSARLEETVAAIEVVKASDCEDFERRKFRQGAERYKGLFVRQGDVEARYLPLLLYGVAVGLIFVHALMLRQAGRLAIAEIIAVMGLMGMLRFPTSISLFAFALVQMGVASAGRIRAVICAESDLDENDGGHNQAISGAITFEDVDFGYGDRLALNAMSFHIQPGETVAIVGQTGSGKTALTQLINRTYDAVAGRILIDGIDVRAWNLSGLRSQIATIEQDVFLFARTIGENIAFGALDAPQEAIEAAARAAQAHEFIAALPHGYETLIGERGVTLSGGQRQRLALARALLADPRILILDDSTSAVDSATEDQIQQAIASARQGRTTVMITHRLSQIARADHILVLDRGRLAASGTHAQLLRRSPEYRRMFARHDLELPPLEADQAPEVALSVG